MKKRLCGLAVLGAVLVANMAGLSGCSGGKTGHDSDSALAPEEETYRYLTDEEKESDSMELQLAPTVKLDGTIMPRSEYEQGLNLYYCKVQEPLTVELTNEEWDSIILARTDEIMSVIEANSSVTFNREEQQIYNDHDVSLPYATVTVPYTDADGEEQHLWVNFVLENDKTARVYGLELGEGDNVDLADNIRRCTPDYSKDALEFGSSITGELAARTFIEEFTGFEFCETSVCVPVSYENIQEMKERHLGEITVPYSQTECYVYYFYWQIDGFPSKRVQAYAKKSEVGELDSSIQGEENQITLEGVSPLSVSCDATGIRSIHIPDLYLVSAESSEIYKENMQMADINTILKRATDYFTEYYTEKVIEIKNVSICYGQKLTDEEDGPAKKIWYPYWTLDVSVKPKYTTTCDTYMMAFDGITGELLEYINDLE